MDEEQLERLISSVGALAEVTSLFFKTLLDQGVDKLSAMTITNSFLNSLLAKK